MIIISLIVLAFTVVFGANVYLIWTLARQGKRKLMYITMVLTTTSTIYLIFTIVAIYKNLKST